MNFEVVFYQFLSLDERAKGIGPSVFSLARRRFTGKLRPRFVHSDLFYLSH